MPDNLTTSFHFGHGEQRRVEVGGISFSKYLSTNTNKPAEIHKTVFFDEIGLSL